MADGQRAAEARAELTDLQQLQQGFLRSHHLSLLGGNGACMLAYLQLNAATVFALFCVVVFLYKYNPITITSNFK